MAGPGDPLLGVENGDDGLGPAIHVTSEASCSLSGDWPTIQRLRSSGSATVADRPIAVIPGARTLSRARASDRRWPRLEVTSECNSSSTTWRRPAKMRSASPRRSERQLLGRGQQDVGGLSFWRARLDCGVSPVRVSIVTGSAMSATGRPRLRSMSTASALSGEM